MIIPRPKAQADCDVCSEESHKINRCGVCLNHFYCSRTCQRQHWATHKFDCSPLPQSEIEPWKASNLEELKREYEWATGWVEQTLQVLGIDPNNGRNVGTEYDEAEHKRLSLELRDWNPPTSLAYTSLNPPKPGATKTSTNWTLLARLYLLHTLATLSPDEIEETALGRPNGGMNAPGTWTQLYMPKVRACADRLSLGEYAALIQLMAIGEINKVGREKQKKAGKGKGTGGMIGDHGKDLEGDEMDVDGSEQEEKREGEAGHAKDGDADKAEAEEGGQQNGPWMKLLILQGALKERTSKKGPAGAGGKKP